MGRLRKVCVGRHREVSIRVWIAVFLLRPDSASFREVYETICHRHDIERWSYAGLQHALPSLRHIFGDFRFLAHLGVFWDQVPHYFGSVFRHQPKGSDCLQMVATGWHHCWGRLSRYSFRGYGENSIMFSPPPLQDVNATLEGASR